MMTQGKEVEAKIKLEEAEKTAAGKIRRRN